MLVPLCFVLVTVVLGACATSPTHAPTINVAPSLPPNITPSFTASGSAGTAPRADASGASLEVDSCALLPAADLSAIIGGPPPVAEPMPGGGWVAGQCAWNGPTSGFFLRVGTAASIAAFGDPAAAHAKAKLAQFKAAAAAEDVAGIGDGAALGATGIAAYQGETYLEVTRLRLTDDQLVEVMRLALASLD